jgi:integrase
MPEREKKPKRERGTGGLIKMRGCKLWYAQYYDQGQRRRVSTKTASKQEAQGVLRNLMSDMDRGGQFIGDLKKLRYADLRRGLLQSYTERGNKSLITTADGTENICGLPALDEFFEYGKDKPGVPVIRITTDAARTFTKKRQAKGFANDTINGSLALLRRMLRLAHEDGKIHVVPKIPLLKAGAARKGFLDRSKFEELLEHIPKKLKPLYIFLYYCGVRLGEALQIEWSQVDLAGKMIRLEATQTKNSEPRQIPLPDALITMLAAVPKDGPVFDSTNYRKSWHKACVAVGLGTLEKVEGKPVKRYNGLLIHDMRRSAIRNMINAGVNEKVAMAISGHKTLEVFRRYNIVTAADTQAAMQKVQSANEI